MAVTRILTLIVLALLSGAGTARAASPSPLLSQIASTYVGKPVVILCATDAEVAAVSPEADAFARPELGEATLRRYDCGQLVLLARGKGDAEMEGQIALILTHESTHLTGVLDEGQTECLAVENVWRMLRLFKRNGPHRLRVAYRAAVELHAAAPAAYRAVC